ncbi:hypothetical protein OUZ56_002461 [Daphnia magna]|uniref:Acid-sensing ion channel 4 n=1 Tax=Daphnia magna TaxID=35525 RepID=A0ABR0A5T3_9CRUS|nr:hypothetical protein OUZ56_002461 [Daphnia magna]
MSVSLRAAHRQKKISDTCTCHKRRLDLATTEAVSVIDFFYESSYWIPDYDYQAMEQQKVSITETNFGGIVYSSDGMETFSDHALCPHPLMAHHKPQCQHQQQSPDAITGGGDGDCGISGNGRQRQSGFLVKRLNAKKTMAEISIPGMRAVFGLGSSLIRRVIWIVILITCFGIAVVQVRDRVIYYMSTPVTVNVRVSRNETLPFPILSICNKNMFNMTAMRILKTEKANLITRTNGTVLSQKEIDNWDVADLVGVRGYNVLELWNFISHSLERMIIECFFGRNKTCEERGKWTRIYNYMGVCYSYTLDSVVDTTGLFNNFYLRLHDVEPLAYKGDASGWKLLIHDRKDSPLVILRSHGTTLYRGWAKDMRVFVRQFRTLNTESRQCSDDHDYSYSKCVAQCFSKAVTDATTCRLPYIDADTVGAVKLCNDSQTYAAANDKVENLLFFGKWSENNCTSCPRQCHQDFYITYTETTEMKRGQENLGKLRIFYQDMTYDDIEEEYGYTAIPLLCDIGGSLGLLLGASVLTFFEIIEAISAALFHLTAIFTTCCCLMVKPNKVPRQL